MKSKLMEVVLITVLMISGGISILSGETNSTIKQETISSGDISEFYIDPDKKTSISFKYNPQNVPHQIKYKIYDIWQTEILSSETAPVQDKKFYVNLTLPQGYYEITFPDFKQTFGICAMPSYKGEKDPFFNIDAALSWWQCHDNLKLTTDMIKFLGKTGVSMARERVLWKSINNQEDKYQFDAGGYSKIRQAYSENGIKVLEMFHDSPGFTRGKNSPYPEDFLKTFQSWDRITQEWGSCWGALEIWNEPTVIGFGGSFPLDQYTPLAHTLAYLMKQKNMNIKLGGPGFAYNNDLGVFKKTLIESSIWDNLDFMSFHYYSDAADLENTVTEYRKLFAIKNKVSIPIWITECGAIWKGNIPPRPELADCIFFAHEIIKKAVEAKACGIERFFPFVFAYYGLHKKGMMGLEGTPLRAMAAYTQCIRTLSNKAYCGDLKLQQPGIFKVRIFASEDETVAVFCMGKSEITKKLTLDMPIIKAEGIDGRSLEITSNGQLPIPDGIAYVWLDKKIIQQNMEQDTKAMRLWNMRRQLPITKKAPSPLIVQFMNNDFCHSKETYFFKKSQEFTIRATNLSDKTIDAIITINVPDGWQLKDDKEKTVSIPPYASRNLKWTVELKQSFKVRLGENYTQFIYILSSVAPENSKDTFAIPIVPELSEEEYQIENAVEIIKLPISDITQWQNNISQAGKLSKSVLKQGGINFKFQVNDKSFLNRWIHPLFPLPEKQRDLRNAGMLITARSKYPLMLILREKEKCGYIASWSIVPVDGNWHTTFISFSAINSYIRVGGEPDTNGKLDLDSIRMISLGASAFSGTEGEFDIKSIYIVR